MDKKEGFFYTGGLVFLISIIFYALNYKNDLTYNLIGFGLFLILILFLYIYTKLFNFTKKEKGAKGYNKENFIGLIGISFFVFGLILGDFNYVWMTLFNLLGISIMSISIYLLYKSKIKKMNPYYFTLAIFILLFLLMQIIFYLK